MVLQTVLCVCVCIHTHTHTHTHTYVHIYNAVLKRLATPSDFHIPLPSIVPFAHSQISLTHRCICPIFSGSLGTASFFNQQALEGYHKAE